MKSTFKLYYEDRDPFIRWLQGRGYTVETFDGPSEANGWQVFRFRAKKDRHPTIAYDGLTHRAKAPRGFLRLVGPRKNLLNAFHKERKNHA